METNKILSLIKTINKFPVDVILVKELILSGVDTEEKLFSLLKDEQLIPQHTKVSMQNYFRDINTGFYDINKIPTIF